MEFIPGVAGSHFPTAVLTIRNCHRKLLPWKVVILHILVPDSWTLWFHPVEFIDEQGIVPSDDSGALDPVCPLQ